ncbi:MAG TPA: VanZ family protein [Chitinophagaceae bacterium]|nr:VanZ family protein [Chitinophagaceae bacterium]
MFFRSLYLIFFVLYIPLLITITFFYPERERLFKTREYHLIPFQNVIAEIKDPAQYDTPGYWRIFAAGLVGNVVLFLPLGFFLRFFIPYKKTIILCYGIAVSICIELVQLIFHLGVCDIDDVILNTAGLYMGILCCMTLHPATKRAAGKFRS